jgi:hypothetical protein
MAAKAFCDGLRGVVSDRDFDLVLTVVVVTVVVVGLVV